MIKIFILKIRRNLFCGTYKTFIIFIITLFLTRFVLVSAYCQFWQFVFSLWSCSNENYSPKTFNFPVKVFSSPSQCFDRTKLIIFVPSVVNNFDQRRVVRETWGRSFTNDVNYKLIFAVGSDQGSHSGLKIEVEKFNDIVWFDFTEHYHNISLKIFHTFNWISLNCPNVRYVLRADPDIFVFKNGLEHFLKHEISQEQITIYGYCREYDCVMRFPSSKTCMPKSWYSSNWYPKYCFGFSYLFPSDVLKIVLPLWRRWPYYFPLDDILFTGLIAESSPKKIHRRNIKLFDYQKYYDQFSCSSKQIAAASYINLEDAVKKWSSYVMKCQINLE